MSNTTDNLIRMVEAIRRDVEDPPTCDNCGGDGYTVDTEGDDQECETCEGTGEHEDNRDWLSVEVERIGVLLATCGGPHIEVRIPLDENGDTAGAGTVEGWWGGDHIVRHISPEAADALWESVGGRYVTGLP